MQLYIFRYICWADKWMTSYYHFEKNNFGSFDLYCRVVLVYNKFNNIFTINVC